jgi:hypothetical protein
VVVVMVLCMNQIPIKIRDLIIVLHHHNNCTTISHMKVGPSVWNSFSCERLLYNYYIGVVNLTFTPKER